MLKFLIISTIFTPFLSECHPIDGDEKIPEKVTYFLEPLKNTTVSAGNNVEFSCQVANLENQRIIWTFKPTYDPNEVVLGISGLKVTKNPKISLSVIPRSGDIIESILYVYNVSPKEEGVYTCSVNTEPVMIRQKGTLNLNSNKNDEDKTQEATFGSDGAVIVYVQGRNDMDDEGSAEDRPVDDQSNSDLFCIDIHKIWKDVKTGTAKLFKDAKTETDVFFKDTWKKMTSWF